MAVPTQRTSSYNSIVKQFSAKKSLQSVVIKQSPGWENWIPFRDGLGPQNLGNAPVMLSLGPKNYWMFGQKSRGGGARRRKQREGTASGGDAAMRKVNLDGFLIFR